MGKWQFQSSELVTRTNPVFNEGEVIKVSVEGIKTFESQAGVPERLSVNTKVLTGNNEGRYLNLSVHVGPVTNPVTAKEKAMLLTSLWTKEQLTNGIDEHIAGVVGKQLELTAMKEFVSTKTGRKYQNFSKIKSLGVVNPASSGNLEEIPF